MDAIKLALDQLKDDGGDQLLQQVMQEVGLGTMNPIVSPITSPAKAPALSDFEVETAARDLELEMEKMDQSAIDQAVPTDVRHMVIAHEVLETPASEENVIILGWTQMEELEIPP